MPELTQGSPEWWLRELHKRQLARRPQLDKLENYYAGKHKLQFATPKFKDTFGNLFKAFADNWCDLIVEASVERLEVQGFRLGNSDEADKDAWDVWQRNFLDADSDLAILEAVKLGESAVIVEPGDKPRITVEHPTQVIVATDSGDRRRRAAALKVWLNDWGYLFATVYLPDGVYKFQSSATVDMAGAQVVEWKERDAVEHRAANPFGVVPVVPLENAPGMLTGGKSDLTNAIPVQDAINKLVLDMLVASEFAAMRQRWATGVELPRDDDGHEVGDEASFVSWMDRVWTAEDSEAKFGEFQAGDLGNYVGAIGLLIQHLSAQTKTPPHYLLGQVVNASGDALKAAETGLVSKVRRKQRFMGPGWSEVMRLALRVEDGVRVETSWRDTESRSVGELVDAATKMQSLGVPEDALWEFIGATPQQIERWKKSRDAELLAAEALAFAGVRPSDQGLPSQTADEPKSDEPTAATPPVVEDAS